VPALRARTQISLASGLRSVLLSLWDEEAGRMVDFSHRRPALADVAAGKRPAR
jgi:hypothetical protein